MTTWGSAVRCTGLLLSLWLVACGERPREEPREDLRGGPAEDFTLARDEAECRWNARCGAIRDDSGCANRGRAEIEARRALGIPFPHLGAPLIGALHEGRIRFDEDLAARCLTRLRALSCEEESSSLADECDPYVGQRQVGETCLDSRECVADAYCRLPAGPQDVCVAGTCMPDLGVGERPQNGPQPCARGLAQDSTGACQRIPAEGESCAWPMPCQQGLFCNARTSTCEPKAKEGQACVKGESSCLNQLDCGDQGLCQRKGRLGDPCTSTFPFPTGGLAAAVTLGCLLDLRCAGASSSQRGVCAEFSGEGASCLLQTCRSPFVCAHKPGSTYEGSCRAPAQAGQACDLSADCVLGFWCDARTNTCAARGRKLGDACDASSLDAASRSCIAGFTCRGGRCAPDAGGNCEG